MSSIFKKRDKKLIRTKISLEETEILKNYFVNQKFPSKYQRNELAKSLNKSERTIQVWFQNNRQRNTPKESLKKNNSQNVDIVENSTSTLNNDCFGTKMNEFKDNLEYLSFSQILSIYNINKYQNLKVILNILSASYRKNKYPNAIELSSIYYITNLDYNKIYLWFIYKNTFYNTNINQDLNILSYLSLFPPNDDFNISCFIFIINFNLF